MQLTSSNKKLVAGLALAVVAMFGFGYALVPLYDLFCEITGIGGKPAIAAVQDSDPTLTVDASRDVTVEFTYTSNYGLAWKVKPQVRKMKAVPGKIYQIDYAVKNELPRDVIGQAIPSVTPGAAAKHLVKIECFCFEQQKLAAAEEKDMPVRFYVDSQLSKDINTITLSYSFFEVKSDQTAGG